jgi:hypothetical protein
MSRKTINNCILKLENKKPVTTLVVKQASNNSSSMSKITKDTCWDDSFVAVSKVTSIGETSNKMDDTEITDDLTTSEASVTSTSDNSTTVDDELYDKANANKSNTTTGVTTPSSSLRTAFSSLPLALQHICGNIHIPSDDGNALLRRWHYKTTI